MGNHERKTSYLKPFGSYNNTDDISSLKNLLIDTEFIALEKEGAKALDRLRAESRPLLSYSEEGQIASYMQKLTSISSYTAALALEIEKIEIDQIMSQDYRMKASLLVGSEIYAYRIIERIGKMAEKHGFTSSYNSWLPVAINFSCPTAFVKRGETRALDVVFKKESPLSTTAQYKFLVQSLIPDVHPTFVQTNTVISEDDPTHLYPIRRKYYSNNLSRLMMTAVTPEKDLEIVRNRSRGKQMENQLKSAEQALEYIHHRDEIGRRCFDILANPDNPEFPELSKTIEELLTYDSQSFIFTLLNAGVYPSTSIQMYRLAKKFAKSDHPSAPFYSRFAEVVLNNAERLGVLKNKITPDDLNDIYAGERSEFKSENKYSTQLVFDKKPNRRNFSLSDKQLSSHIWGGFGVPTRVSVDFDKNAISATYEYLNDETGESESFTFGLDTRTQNFEWNLIESPDDPEFECVKFDAIRSLQELIMHIPEPQTNKTSVFPDKPNGSYSKRIRNQDIIYDLRKEARKSVAHEQVDLNLLERDREKSLKQIDSADRDFIESLSEFTTDEQKRIREAIDKFNSRDNHSFRNFSKLGQTENWYRLRVGKLRIILEENGGVYLAKSIGYRKDIYRILD